MISPSILSLSLSRAIGIRPTGVGAHWVAGSETHGNGINIAQRCFCWLDLP